MRILHVITLICLLGSAFSTYDPIQVSLLIEVSLGDIPPSIELRWNYVPVDDFSYFGSTFQIYRTNPYSLTNFGSPIHSKPVLDVAGSYSFMDTNIEIGVAYEYWISLSPFYDVRPYIEGFVVAGIELPLIEKRGHVILVVEQNAASNMTSELYQLKMDLIGDGWEVTALIVSSSESVTAVHGKIAEAHGTNAMSTIFLFGNIPVPYSGDVWPDSHAENRGAWPADIFYSSLDTSLWTDIEVNRDTAQNPINQNVPGDGNFDISFITPAYSDLEIGRVDLDDFDNYDEMMLLRRYLTKNHGFRHRYPEYTYAQRALIDDDFKNIELFDGEAFAAGGWRTFSGLVGKENIFEADMFETLGTQSAVWTMGTGYGTLTSEQGVGSTWDFLDRPIKSAFSLHYGSYFLNWNTQNNLLRAITGSKHILTAMYSGRPFAYFHHMNSGTHTGLSARLTNANDNKYFDNWYGNIVCQALLGDPTLRMYPVDPPKNVTEATSDTNGLSMTWTASSDTVLSYYVYRSTVSIEGPYTRLTDQWVTATSFTDSSPAVGKNYYMVRAVQLTRTPATTFYNPSQAAFYEATYALPSPVTPDSTSSPGTPQPSTAPSDTTPQPSTAPSTSPSDSTPHPVGTPTDAAPRSTTPMDATSPKAVVSSARVVAQMPKIIASFIAVVILT